MRTAAARFPTRPAIEIALGVSRDSIRRLRTTAENSAAVVGLAPGAGAPLPGRSLCSTPIASATASGGSGFRLRLRLDLRGRRPSAGRAEGPVGVDAGEQERHAGGAGGGRKTEDPV